MFNDFTLAFTVDDLRTQVLGILQNPFIVAGLLSVCALFLVPRFVRVLKRIVFDVGEPSPGFPDDPVDAPETPYLRRKGIREKHAQRMAWRRPEVEGRAANRVIMHRVGQKVLHRGRLARRGRLV